MIKPFRSKWTRWSYLGELGRSRPVQLSVFFPAIGYLLLFSEAANSWLCGASSMVCATGDALPWKLVFVYFGLAFLGVGAFVFGIKCPSIHARYADEVEFIEREVNLGIGGALNWSVERLERTLILHEHAMPEILARVYENEIGRLRSAGEAERPVNIGYYAYQITNWSRPRWRVTTALLFAAGFTFLAVPSLATFLKIISLLVAPS